MTRVRHHEFVEITGEIRARTEKALLFWDGDQSVWLPLSQIEDETMLEDGKTVELLIPEWLAKDKGLV
ncbi:MAG: hypothetical protein ACYC9K_01055 [Sulfuricaulis sp.]